MDEQEVEEEDISNDENYSGDGEEEHKYDDSNLDFQCLFKCNTKHYQEPLFAFFTFI